MGATNDVVGLFSARSRTYDRFIRAFRYPQGLAALLRKGGWLKPEARVLDAGCGTGAFTKAVHAAAPGPVRLHAFDLTPAMLEHLRGWAGAEGVDLASVVADVTRLDDLPPDWRGFDLVVSSAMLEYLPPTRLPSVLAALADRLGDGGTMVVCITRRNLLMRGLIGAWWESHLYSRAEIDAIFRQATLEPRFLGFPGLYRYLDVWGHVIEIRR